MIAVPSYENRVMPRFGQAKEFHFADIDATTGKIIELRVHQLPASLLNFQTIPWLVQHEVQGVICAGIHPRFQSALQSEDIWVCWGYIGEVVSVIKQWIADGMLVSRQEPVVNMHDHRTGRQQRKLIDSRNGRL